MVLHIDSVEVLIITYNFESNFFIDSAVFVEFSTYIVSPFYDDFLQFIDQIQFFIDDW
jgi:hypothetical protein